MAARACKTYTQYCSICMYWKYFIVCVQLIFRLCYSFRCQWHCGTSVCIFMKKKQPTGTECVSKAACMYVFVIHLFFRFMCPIIAIEVAADFVYIETHNTCCVLLLMTLLLNLYTYICYSNRASSGSAVSIVYCVKFTLWIDIFSACVMVYPCISLS